jgi:F-type H+-transporting ATPase subunit delta
MLTEKGRENFIVQIAEVYTSLYLADKNVVVANITTATALDEDMRNKFKDIVRKKTGKKEVQLKEQVNADLIGGFILRVGDIQEDTSIQQKLKKISRDFKENRTMLTA